ncbi:unnamed protein product [Cuscuta epithymum]|uniref:RING-type E3 ubiquitin transferase n=1 Tax=Cuscuta epithymum TaxID=186058 RepID=A0AAV0FT31_9ASTE|nr:unnamed protein product [Cuscuta epithymum]CAH9138505.1 unnamed protein product [Cuscuta epithymum]
MVPDALILAGYVLIMIMWAAAVFATIVTIDACLRRSTSSPPPIPNTNVFVSVGERLPRRPPPEVRLNVRTLEESIGERLPRRPPPEVRLNIRTFEEGSLRAGVEDGCAICITGFEKGALSTVLQACDHKFHSDCVSVWLAINKSCPLCRAPAAQVPSQP